MSLFRTFWGWAVLGNLLLVISFVWADVAMDRGLAVPVEIAHFAITAYLFRFLYFPFTALAVLTSAENYTDPRLWPILAKALTVGLWLIFLGQLLVGMRQS